jgi:hypothetical protein
MIQSIEDGRKEAGQRSIADKIIKRLHDLEKTVEHNQGRWAWELLQNAKDSIAGNDNRIISIQIELDKNSVTFRHNGTNFTNQDVIGLIDQISSKEVEEGQETNKTGRFGTGFLTTHLLSRVIEIKGIVESEDEKFRKFKFLLDRTGKTTTNLMPRIANSWKEFDESIEEIIPNYNKSQFNTSFCYQLDTDEQRRIAQVGVEEFSKLIPFVLAFISKIGVVEIIDNVTGQSISYEKNREIKDSSIVHISKIKNNKQESILILYSSNDRVSIATEVEKCESGYSVKGVRDLPRLFCDFPLIGTENFNFPVIVNSFFFNPQTERDGIWLNNNGDTEVIENQKLLESAVCLYKDLVSKLVKENFFNLYNMAEIKIPSIDNRYFDKKWYQDFIQKPMRDFIYNALIVELEDGSSEKKAIKDLCFPKASFSETVRNKIWQFVFDLEPNAVCKKKHLHNWCEIAWEEWQMVDYKAFVDELVRQGNIYKLSHTLRRDEDFTFTWLNSLGTFLLEDSNSLLLIQKNPITPNQNGQFRKITDLYIDAIQDDQLVCILELLGVDWKDILLHNSMNYMRNDIQEKEKRDIAIEITGSLKKKLNNPVYNNSDNFVKAISLLSEWFENNSEEGRELFAEIYLKRAEIFMNTIRDKESLYKVMRTCTNLSKLAEVAKAIEDDSEIIEKIQAMKEITSLLEEFKADSISELKTIMRLSQGILTDGSNKIEINEEILLSLGVTSVKCQLTCPVTTINLAG